MIREAIHLMLNKLLESNCSNNSKKMINPLASLIFETDSLPQGSLLSYVLNSHNVLWKTEKETWLQI